MEELIAYIGYLNGTTKDEQVKKETRELLLKYWVHPKDIVKVELNNKKL